MIRPPSLCSQDITFDRTGRQLMTEKTPAAILAAATLAAAAALLAGCAGEEPMTNTAPSAPSSTAPRAQQWSPGQHTTEQRSAPAVPTELPPTVAELDRGNADAVADAAVTLWFTWDTTTDSGPNDGSVRATPLLADPLARMVATEVPAQGPGGDWLSWATQKARLVPTVTANQEPVPPQTDQKAYRSYLVDQAVTLPDGTVTEHRQSVVDVILARGESGWEVSRVNLR